MSWLCRVFIKTAAGNCTLFVCWHVDAFVRVFFLFSSYLLGLLAKIKCSISSSQPDLWDLEYFSSRMIRKISETGLVVRGYLLFCFIAIGNVFACVHASNTINVTSVLQYFWELRATQMCKNFVFLHPHSFLSLLSHIHYSLTDCGQAQLAKQNIFIVFLKLKGGFQLCLKTLP